jgi:hypothetical protein
MCPELSSCALTRGAQPDQPVADPGLHRAEGEIEQLGQLALA